MVQRVPDGFGPRLAGKVVLSAASRAARAAPRRCCSRVTARKVVGSDVNARRRATRSAAEAAGSGAIAEHGGSLTAFHADIADEDECRRVDRRGGRASRPHRRALQQRGVQLHGNGARDAARALAGDAARRARRRIPAVQARDPAPAPGRAGRHVDHQHRLGLGDDLDAMPEMPGGMAHAAGKGGVLAFTRSLADEYAPDGIRANAISPGSVWTPSLALRGLRHARVPRRRRRQPLHQAPRATRGGCAPRAVSGVRRVGLRDRRELRDRRWLVDPLTAAVWSRVAAFARRTGATLGPCDVRSGWWRHSRPRARSRWPERTPRRQARRALRRRPARPARRPPSRHPPRRPRSGRAACGSSRGSPTRSTTGRRARRRRPSYSTRTCHRRVRV